MPGDRPYLVGNCRPRKAISLFGRTLGPRKAGRSREMWLTEDQFQSSQVQTYLDRHWLELLKGPQAQAPVAPPVVEEPEAEEPLAPEPEIPAEPTFEVPEPEVEPAPEPETEPTTEPVSEPEVVVSESSDDAPEVVDNLADLRARDEDGTFIGDDPATEDVNEAWKGDVPPVTEEKVIWTEESLEALGYRGIQGVAKEMDVKASGKEADIIARILEAQGA